MALLFSRGRRFLSGELPDRILPVYAGSIVFVFLSQLSIFFAFTPHSPSGDPMNRNFCSRDLLLATSISVTLLAGALGCSSGQAEMNAIASLEKKGGTVVGESTSAGVSRRLNLNNSSVTNEDLKLLADISNIELLWLYGTKVTDEGMLHIAALNQLKHLDLRNLPVTDEGLAHLAACKKLEALSIAGTSVTPEGLNKFRESLPKCKVDY